MGSWWEGLWGNGGKGCGEMVGRVVGKWWEGWWVVGDIGYEVGVKVGRGRVWVDKRRRDRQRQRQRQRPGDRERERSTVGTMCNNNFCVNNNFLST